MASSGGFSAAHCGQLSSLQHLLPTEHLRPRYGQACRWRQQGASRQQLAAAAAAARSTVRSQRAKQARGKRQKQQQQPAERQLVRVGQVLELECHSLAFGGQGVCRLADGAPGAEAGSGGSSGYVVLTSGALPGELLRARAQKVSKGHASAVKTATLRLSPDAATPPCPHFGPCGGCSLQGLQYDAQLAAKQAQVADVLRRIAGVDDVDARMRPIAGCGEQYNYRNKMEFSFSDRTWVPDDSLFGGAAIDAPALGLARPGHANQVLPIRECWLQDDAANGILQTVSAALAAAHIQPLVRRSRQPPSGLLQRLAIRAGSCPETGAAQHMVHLTTAANVEAAAQLGGVVAALRDNCPSVVSVVRTDAAPQRGGSQQPGGASEAEVLWGSPTISQELGGLRYDISAQAFFQTNTRQAARLHDMVAAAAGLRDGNTDVAHDLFCGAGFFGLALAARAATVHGFERSAAAVADARRNAERGGIRNAVFQEADLDSFTPDAGIPAPDVVIADPGRAGMSQRLLQWLAGCGARRLVYVSCNPATQARDLAVLLGTSATAGGGGSGGTGTGTAGTAATAGARGGYQLDYVQACDLFPQTSHVESMAVLTAAR